MFSSWLMLGVVFSVSLVSVVTLLLMLTLPHPSELALLGKTGRTIPSTLFTRHAIHKFKGSVVRVFRDRLQRATTGGRYSGNCQLRLVKLSQPRDTATIMTRRNHVIAT